jgi:hypothetical protein
MARGILESGRWWAVDQLDQDETVEAMRTRGPVPLPLDGWDRASIWGWDETRGSLYARLWRNTDDPAKSPAIQIKPDDYTPAITFAATLAQHIAIVAACSPWRALTALHDAAQLDDGEDEPVPDGGVGTAVTLTEGHSLPEWPYRAEPRMP